MELLRSQKLLKRNGEVVLADNVLEGKSLVCFYFSAGWCPLSQRFTPILADFYKEAVTGEGCHPLEVVFVSKDDSPSDMLEHMKDAHGDWLAVQHGAKLISELCERFSIRGIPALVVVAPSAEGQQVIVSKTGRKDLSERRHTALMEWIEAASSSQPESVVLL